MKLQKLIDVPAGLIEFLPFTVQAGFPTPAADYAVEPVDINRFVITNPTATYFAKVEGNSMIDIGIHVGSYLVVDKSVLPKNNDIIVAVINGEFIVKRLNKIDNKILLVPANTSYSIIEIDDTMDFVIWGVVTWVFTPSACMH